MTAHALGAVGLTAVLVLGGCSLFQDEPAERPSEGERSSAGADPAAGQEQLLIASANLAAAGGTDAEAIEVESDLPVLATRQAATGGLTMEIDLNGVVVDGTIMSVLFTVRNTGDDDLQIAQAFDDGLFNNSEVDGVGIHNINNTDGVFVLDGANAKRHSAAYDSAGFCICSGALDKVNLAPDQQAVLATTFTAVPQDVDSVMVSIPLVGQFADVPVTR